MTDEALLPLCKTSEDALETMIRRYFRLVTACAHSFFLVGAEQSDLVQEGLIGLLAAIRSYDPEQELPFPAYARLCIRRRMISAVRSANAEKNGPLNDAVPLAFDGGAVGSDPEAAYLGKEQTEDLLAELNTRLSKLEREVLRLYLEGWSAREIAERLQKPVKSADNAIQRIRAKTASLFPRR